MNVRRIVLLSAALLLALLVPSASMPGANYNTPLAHDPFMAVGAAPGPLDAYKPSAEEVRAQIAQNTLDRFPEHFQCREYPEGPQPNDLIPTANVTTRVSFDHHTGQFETIKVDPRIVISYRTVYETSYDVDHEPNSTTPGAYAADHYSWTLEPGVELYGVYVRAVDTDGHAEWTTISQLELKPADNFTAYREELDGRELDVWIVATDTTNCRQDSNPLPDGMWGHLDLANSTSS